MLVEMILDVAVSLQISQLGVIALNDTQSLDGATQMPTLAAKKGTTSSTVSITGLLVLPSDRQLTSYEKYLDAITSSGSGTFKPDTKAFVVFVNENFNPVAFFNALKVKGLLNGYQWIMSSNFAPHLKNLMSINRDYYLNLLQGVLYIEKDVRYVLSILNNYVFFKIIIIIIFFHC